MLKPQNKDDFNLNRDRQEYSKWEIYWWATSGKRADGYWHSTGVMDSTREGIIEYITKARKANPEWWNDKFVRIYRRFYTEEVLNFEDVP